MPNLVVIEGPAAVQFHTIKGDHALVARGLNDPEKRHLPLDPDAAVSEPLADGTRAAHARVFERGGVWWLEDLGSLNGTWVKDGEVPVRLPQGKARRLNSRDAFVCGLTTVVFWEGEVRPDASELERLRRKSAGIRLRETKTDADGGGGDPTVYKPR